MNAVFWLLMKWENILICENTHLSSCSDVVSNYVDKQHRSRFNFSMPKQKNRTSWYFLSNVLGIIFIELSHTILSYLLHKFQGLLSKFYFYCPLKRTPIVCNLFCSRLLLRIMSEILEIRQDINNILNNRKHRTDFWHLSVYYLNANDTTTENTCKICVIICWLNYWDQRMHFFLCIKYSRIIIIRKKKYRVDFNIFIRILSCQLFAYLSLY